MIRKLLLLAAAGSVWIATADTAAAQKLEYDCDTQAEHYSVLKAAQDGPAYSAAGNISLRDVFAAKKYVTLGMLQLGAPDGSWSARVGLTALKAGKDLVVMGSLRIIRDGKAEEPLSIGEIFSFEKDKTYPIALTLGAEGGSATLGSYVLPIKLQAKGKVEASVVCSGGEFLFTDLNLGG